MIHAIVWSDDLETGVEQLDTARRNLAVRFNTILTSARHGAAQSELRTGLAEFRSLTALHCEWEEGRMAEAQYPRLDLHRADHRGLLHRLDRLVAIIDAGQQPVDAMILGFVKDWLLDHVKTEDRDFGRFVAESAAAARNTTVS